MRHPTVASLLMLILSTTASAQTDPLTFDDIHPNLHAIEAAADLIAASHCTTRACQAMALVDRAMDIIHEGMSTMMGVTWKLPPNVDQIVDQRWRREILSHPELFGAICGAITGLASRYQDNEPHLGDKFVAVEVIQLAARIDGKKGTCLARVLAAYPHIPAAETAIEDARTSCTYSWKPWTNCKRITR